MATQDDYIRTALRVPPDLHAQIHEAAKTNNRTFNAEIVARLEGTFKSPVQRGLSGLLTAGDEVRAPLLAELNLVHKLSAAETELSRLENRHYRNEALLWRQENALHDAELAKDLEQIAEAQFQITAITTAQEILTKEISELERRIVELKAQNWREMVHTPTLKKKPKK